MNLPLLEYEMKRKGVTKRELCELLGINPATFWRKCTGYSDFTLREIRQIVAKLQIENPCPIFFDD